MRGSGAGLVCIAACMLIAACDPFPKDTPQMAAQPATAPVPDVSKFIPTDSHASGPRCPLEHKFSSAVLLAMTPDDRGWLDKVDAFLVRCRARREW